MAKVLKFEDAIGTRDVPAERRTARDVASRSRSTEHGSDDFWPEVSSGLWVCRGPLPVDPANKPGRVLAEMALILGGAGLMVLLTTIFVGVPSP